MSITPKIQINNIDDYIASQPEQIKSNLEKLRQTINKSAPDAQEVISYHMPAFKYHGMLAYFACFTNHYSLFISPEVMKSFKDKLTDYETSKSAIRVPLNKPVPVKLVTEIIKCAVNENLSKKAIKDSKKKLKAKK